MGFSNALREILPSDARLEGFGETLEDAVTSLNKVSDALASDQYTSRKNGHDVSSLLSSSPARQPLVCCVCHLDSMAVYDRDCEAAYLLIDDKLVLIDTVRRSRECDHWRVSLVGFKASIPVKDTATCVVSNNFNLTGKTMKEVL